MLEKIKKFLSESRQELRHVNWPTKAEAMRLTGIVIGMSLGLAVFLGSFDFIFTDVVKNIVLGNPNGIPVETPTEEQSTEDGITINPEDIEVSTEDDAILDGEAPEGGKIGIEIEPLSTENIE